MTGISGFIPTTGKGTPEFYALRIVTPVSEIVFQMSIAATYFEVHCLAPHTTAARTRPHATLDGANKTHSYMQQCCIIST